MSVNLATSYAKKVDEKFYRESQALMGCGNSYEFTGNKTVVVQSMPTVSMTDYTRSGNARYGTASELSNTLQSMTVTKDRAFTFTLDKGNKIQDQMIMDAGKALSRQLREQCVPEFDRYIFQTQINKAVEKRNTVSTTATKNNAYELFLAATEHMGNKNVPDTGLLAYCSYGYANLLKQDTAFMKYGNTSQDMVRKGIMGEVDGVKLVKVPSSRLPAGAGFLMVHPIATCAPKQLEDYKIHDNPPGISGWLVEGRMIYDCFVLNEKADALYYLSSQPTLRVLEVVSIAGSATGKSEIHVLPGGGTYKYRTGTSCLEITHGAAISEGWSALTNDAEITPTSGHTVIQIVEVDTDSKAIGQGSATLAIA